MIKLQFKRLGSIDPEVDSTPKATIDLDDAIPIQQADRKTWWLPFSVIWTRIRGESIVLTGTSGTITTPFSKNVRTYKGTANGARTMPSPSATNAGCELFVLNDSSFDFTLNGVMHETGAIATKTIGSASRCYLISNGEYWIIF